MKPLVHYIICPPHWTKTPPLGLSYLKKYAQKYNIDLKIIDLNMRVYHKLCHNPKTWLPLDNNFEKSLFSFVKTRCPESIDNILGITARAELIGFSMFKRNKPFTYALIDEIKKERPHQKIVIGGPETLWMQLKKSEFRKDISWVIGEGERSIRTLLNTSENVFIAHDEVENLDNIPSPDFVEFDLSKYAPSLPILSSRGCINKCAFCTERLLSNRFRQHSPGYIVDQIQFLADTYKIHNFIFQDSLINANLSWIETFSKLILKTRIKINWEAQAIVRKDFTKKLSRLMKQSGCYNLFIGVESASNHVLNGMNKGITQADILKFLTMLHEGGLHCEISLITGYPCEKENNFQETLDFIRKQKKVIPKIAQINPYINYFSDNYKIEESSYEKVKRLITLLKEENIPYTKSYINNLSYTNKNENQTN